MFRKLFGKQTTATAFPAQVAPGERIYAVGDIHGRQDLLEAMMTAIYADITEFSDERRPRIIFLGDYIDRGDRSQEVIQTLSGLAFAPPRVARDLNVLFGFLAGNHEVALLNFLKKPIAGKGWLDWGGLQTLASFGIRPVAAQVTDHELEALRDSVADAVAPYLSFLQGLSRTIVSGNVVFVHAALDPASPLDKQPDEATLWGTPPSGQKPGFSGYKMVHGHFADVAPVSLPDRICVDTGAFYSGKLTALRLDAQETFLSVQA